MTLIGYVDKKYPVFHSGDTMYIGVEDRVIEEKFLLSFEPRFGYDRIDKDNMLQIAVKIVDRVSN